MSELKPLPPLRRKSPAHGRAQPAGLAAKLMQALTHTLAVGRAETHALGDLGALAAELQLARVNLETLGEGLWEAQRVAESAYRRFERTFRLADRERLIECLHDLTCRARRIGTPSRQPLTEAGWTLEIPLTCDTCEMRHIPRLFRSEGAKALLRARPDLGDVDRVRAAIKEAWTDYIDCRDAIMDVLAAIEKALDEPSQD